MKYLGPTLAKDVNDLYSQNLKVFDVPTVGRK
jgi:hypothetical protein